MCSLKEDIEHLYFINVGILLCVITDWRAAIAAALATFFIRAAIRHFNNKKEEEK